MFCAVVILTSLETPRPFNISEQWYLTVCCPFAAVFMGLILARCLSLIRSLTLLETTTSENSQLVDAAMGKLNLPPSVQTRISRYHKFIMYERNSTARDALFRDLSPNLNLELRLILFVELIEKAPCCGGGGIFE